MISVSYRHFISGILLFLCAFSATYAAESIARLQEQDLTLNRNNANTGVNILAIAELTNISINGFKVSELSGLAWDADENTLYAISDNGYVLHLRPEFKNDQLTDVLLLNGFALHDDQNKPLKWKRADSEGLAIKQSNNGIVGDTELLVSFERRPRIIRYNSNGTFISSIELPEQLRDIKNYESENKSLEAITAHVQLGVLVGVESPLKGTEQGMLNIYSMNGNNWKLPAANASEGGLVGMTSLDDGNLLILERAYTGILPKFEIALHRVSIKDNVLSEKIIAKFLPDEELFNDNFEGITYHKNNYFFMISDDNNHPFKRTLLIYFHVPE
ncbi:MAG: esterase-like activity of phytase family protein [Gammaproteobacteria bacterium]